jgi:Abnormal spindle-like microcephaly-assoc'd, ASPM-SPD-2-Hydin/Beta-propeller repeat
MNNLKKGVAPGRVPLIGAGLAALIVTAALVSWPHAGSRSALAHASAAPSQLSAAPLTDAAHAAQKQIAENYGRIPLSFEANRGQTDPEVKFLSRGPGYTLFLTADEAVLKLQRPETIDSAREASPSHPESASVVRMKLVGANPAVDVSASNPLPGKSNYFIGRDASKWHSDVPTYSQVRYRQAYPGVDLVYYGNPQQLEYDFVVAPGADPSVITLDLASTSKAKSSATDATRLRINEKGDLLIPAQDRDIQFKRPVAYQEEPGSQGTVKRRFIDGRWILRNSHQVGFELSSYDHSKALIIDPAVTYFTYLGGTLDNTAYNVSADAAGNAYVTGNTTSTDFPTKNPYQAANAGSSDVFVAKLNSTGTSLIYSTYIGGSSQDYAFWISVSAGGNVHVTGSTSSADFPVTAGVVQSTCGGGCLSGTRNVFVTVLNSAGSALIYSTYLGGTGQDQANEIQTDSMGNTYIVGWTTSSNFPTTAGALQTTFAGTSDAFVAKLNPKGTTLMYSTLLGVSNDTRAFGIGINKSGEVYITGFTSSAGFPTTAGAFQSALKGTSNGFVSEINSAGSALVYSTYIGGSGADISWGLALDSSDNVYIIGQTTSTNFPTTPGALRTTCSTTCNLNDAFVAKMNSTGTALVYSTYLGGSGEQEAYALAIDASGDAFATGRTKATNFPTTPGAFSAVNKGVYDSFVSELDPTGGALVYSSYFGGTLTDTGLGIAVDAAGNIYFVGRTYSPDLPITPKAIQPLFVGETQSYIAKLVPGVQVWPLALNFGTQTVGQTSAPQTATLTNSGAAALSISNVSLNGTGATDYSLVNNCSTSLAAGASCTVSVTFAPTTTGTLNAALVIADNAANTPQSVALTGVGSAAALTLTPSTMTFGLQLVGTSSPTQPATLTNVTTSAVTINSISPSVQFAETNNCPTSLAAAASCTINVGFQPTVPGTQKGTVTVTDSATTPLTISLTGSATVMSFSPSSLSFGTQKKGTSSQPQTVTVKNTGAVAVKIGKISITGSRVTSFSQTNTCPISPATLAAGTTCTASVTFTPQLVGALTANLTFADSGGGNVQNVPLSGTGN